MLLFLSWILTIRWLSFSCAFSFSSYFAKLFIWHCALFCTLCIIIYRFAFFSTTYVYFLLLCFIFLSLCWNVIFLRSFYCIILNSIRCFSFCCCNLFSCWVSVLVFYFSLYNIYLFFFSFFYCFLCNLFLFSIILNLNLSCFFFFNFYFAFIYILFSYSIFLFIF